MQNIPTEHTEDTEITALCDDSCTSVYSVYSVVYDFQRHIDAKNVYKSDTHSKFRRWGGCEYVRGNWREGGAGHIRRVICPSRLKRCVEPVETRQSAQQIFTPFIRVRYTGLRPKLFVSIALCGRSAASNCGM